MRRIALLLIALLPVVSAGFVAHMGTDFAPNASQALTEQNVTGFEIAYRGHYGNYTVVVTYNALETVVLIDGDGASKDALDAEITLLSSQGAFGTGCACGSCGIECADSAPPAMPRAVSQDAPTGLQLVGGSQDANPEIASQKLASGSGAGSGAGTAVGAAAPEPMIKVTQEQAFQLLAAFLAGIIATYLALQSRQHMAMVPEEERLLQNETRAGIMEELSVADKIPTDLSNRLNKSKAAVVEHLGALMEAGLVERIETPGKKFVYYRITQKGRQLLLRKAA
jgi:DNA-binding MarR family transcriptional regulator